MEKRWSPTSSRRGDDHDFDDDFDSSNRSSESLENTDEGDVTVYFDSEDNEDFLPADDQNVLALQSQERDLEEWRPIRVVSSPVPQPVEEINGAKDITKESQQNDISDVSQPSIGISSHMEAMEGSHKFEQNDHTQGHLMKLRRRQKTNYFEGSQGDENEETTDRSGSVRKTGADSQCCSLQGSSGRSPSIRQKKQKATPIKATIKKVQKKKGTKNVKTGYRRNRSLDGQRAYEQYFKLCAPTEIKCMAFSNNVISSFIENVSSLETEVKELENTFKSAAMAFTSYQETQRNAQNLNNGIACQYGYSKNLPEIMTFSNSCSMSEWDQFEKMYNRQEAHCIAACPHSDVTRQVPVTNSSAPLGNFESYPVDQSGRRINSNVTEATNSEFADQPSTSHQSAYFDRRIEEMTVHAQTTYNCTSSEGSESGLPILSGIDASTLPLSTLLEHFKQLENKIKEEQRKKQKSKKKPAQIQKQTAGVSYNCNQLVNLISDDRLVYRLLRIAPSKRKRGSKKNVDYKDNKDAEKRRVCDEKSRKDIANFKEAIKQKELEYADIKIKLSFTTLDVCWIESKCEQLRENYADSLIDNNHELDAISYTMEVMKNVVSRAIHQIDQPLWITEETCVQMYLRTLGTKRKTSSSKQ